MEIDPDHVVFVDETGNYIILTPRFGRAPRGQRCVGQMPPGALGAWEKNTTLMAALTQGGIQTSAVIEGAMDRPVLDCFVEQFLEEKAILSLTEEIMNRFGQVRGALRIQGKLIGDLDLLIGVTAVHHELELVTRNRRHFDRIPDLTFYSGSS